MFSFFIKYYIFLEVFFFSSRESSRVYGDTYAEDESVNNII